MKSLYILIALAVSSSAISQTVHKHFGLAGAGDSPMDMCVLPSGNIIALGWTYSDTTLQLVKINGQTGDVMFFKRIERIGVAMSNAFGFKLLYTLTGKVLATGSFQDDQSNYADHPPMLLLFDTLGTMLLAKGLGPGYWDEAGLNSIEVASGKYALTTNERWTDDYAGTTVMLVDETATVTAARNFQGTQYFSVGAVAALADQSLMLAGGTQWHFNVEFDYESVIMKVNATLDPIWAKTYIGPDTRYVDDILPTTDGGFITIGWANDTGASIFDMLIMKINSTGTPQWAKRYSNPDNRLFIYDFELNPDGSILVAATYLHTAANNYEGMIMKTDATGNVLWAHNYGDSVGATAYFDRVSAVVERPGGYVFLGSTNQPGHTDYMFGRTDANGLASCYQSFATVSVEDVTADIRDSAITVVDSLAPKTFNNWSGFTTTDITVPSGELCVVGIEPVAPPTLIISPNPADDYVMISTDADHAHLSIINANGQTVLSRAIEKQHTTLTLNGLPAGVYLARIESESGTRTEKLVLR